MPAGVLFGLGAVGSTALLALLLSLWLLKTVRQLKRELRQLQNVATVQREPEPSASFSASLNRAERATVPAAPRVIPQADRYQYVEALATQGLDAGKIAAALQMAPAEVEQLLQLARLKQNVAGRR